MKVYTIEHPFQDNIKLPHSCVAFGNFDGVHHGHQQVISVAKQLANKHSLAAGVMTFDPHPKQFLGLNPTSDALTPLPDKLQRLAQLGLDFVIVVKFNTPFSKLSPEEFIEQYIVKLDILHVVTGFDFSFGYKGEGSVNTLEKWSKERNDYRLHVLSPVSELKEKISSSRIRQLLKAGNVKEANSLLKRAYLIKGKVISGEQRGRTIGFPTANIELQDNYVVPKTGVYAAYAYVQDKKYKAVINIGYKPTFTDQFKKPVLEVHILQFDQQIYGEVLEIEFLDYLREEHKFSSLEELVAQIKKDILLAQNSFSAYQEDPIIQS